MTDDGGPAFPGQTRTNDLTAPKGMSLRDWFAGKAMNTLIFSVSEREDVLTMAIKAYAIADAMLLVRKGDDSFS